MHGGVYHPDAQVAPINTEPVSNCHSCLTARQVPAQADYRSGCLGCQIRHLAHLDGEERQKMLDRIQFVHGNAARNEAVQLLREEMARIKALRVASERARAA